MLAWWHKGANGASADLGADLGQLFSIIVLSFVVLVNDLLADMLVHQDKLFVTVVHLSDWYLVFR